MSIRAGVAAKRSAVVQEILDAARRCFAREGYYKTSIKLIASEAGIRSPSILHYHFTSKEAIFLEVMRRTLGDLTERATRLGLEVAEGPRGLGAIDAFFSLLEDERDLAPLLLEGFTMAARGSPIKAELAMILQGLEELVATAVRALLGPRAEQLPLAPGQLAGTVVDVVSGHALRMSVLDDPAQARDRRQGILTLLGLIRPHQQGAPRGSEDQGEPL
jgi:AcrR family transcriptional regulator